MITTRTLSGLSILTVAVLFFSFGSTSAGPKEDSIPIQYLEIVTTEVDKTCSILEKQHGVSFGKPDAGLGNARTAALKGGGKIGVRAPMADHEKPIVRPYTLVEDIEAAVKSARAAGAEIALPPMEIPGHGKFAISILGGVQHGVWEVSASTSK